MCESKVFIIKGGKKEKIMDEAVLVRDEGSVIIIGGLMGGRKEVKGRIVEIDADKHEILISSDDRTQD
ncbi:MAG: CooT family nickel-binding protein [Candidatus Hydrothermarchaeaceae archaeon]